MTDWHALRDAYGPADSVPTVLDSVTPDYSHPAWDELWSRLCHQGTVYPASFAALPRLEALARAWKGRQRDPILHLTGAIVCSTDRVGVEGDPLPPLDGTIRQLRHLAAECLEGDERSEQDFIYLLQAARGLEGDALWGVHLDCLVHGELSASCPWMRRTAMKAGHPQLAAQLGHLFGTSRCPSCTTSFHIPDAAAAR